jgi:hypothetical protein
MAVPVMMMKLRVEGFESPFLFVIRLTTKGRHAIDERSVSRHFSLFDEFPNLTDTALFFYKANIDNIHDTAKEFDRNLGVISFFYFELPFFVILSLQI